MKKIVVALVTILMGLTLVACGDPSGEKVLNENEVYAVSAVSSVDILNSNALNVPVLRVRANINRLSEVLDETVEEETTEEPEVVLPPSVEAGLKEVEMYTGFIHDMIKGNDAFKTEVIEVLEGAEFANHLKVTTKDLKGNVSTYDFFFNEILIKDESSDEEGEIEIEQKFDIIGKIVLDEKEFSVIGTKEYEFEQDEKETEEELEIKLIITDLENDKNYVKLEYGTETELDEGETEYEKEFRYEVYEEGKKISKTKLDFEYDSDDKETEIKLEVTEGNYKGKYRYVQKDDSTNEIFVKYDVKDKDSGKIEIGTALITIATDEDGKVTYTYQYYDENNLKK